MQYSIRKHQPRETKHSISHHNITPVKTAPVKTKNLNTVLSRLTRQTESSGRKNRNTDNKSVYKPFNVYENVHDRTNSGSTTKSFSKRR